MLFDPFSRTYTTPLLILAAASLVLLAAMHYGAQLRATADVQVAHEIDNESQAYCLKFGVAPGTARHAECVADLMEIRKRHEERVVKYQAGIL